MRKTLPLSALLTTLLASGSAPLLAGNPETLEQMHQDLEQQTQRMHELHERMQDQLNRQMALMLAAAPAPEIWPASPEVVNGGRGWATLQPNPPTEKGPYLGLAATPASAVLREQLKLQRGFGLVVDYVDKDSPAAAAGVHVHDILQKLDDQWIIDPHQLLVLVRSKKPGDAVALTVLREGQPVTLNAKLAERDVPVLEQADVGGPFWPENPQVGPNGQITIHIPGTNERVNANWATLTRSDADHRITIKIDNHSKSATVTEIKTGKVLYDGPANSDDDLKSLPADIQGKVKELLDKVNSGLNVEKGP